MTLRDELAVVNRLPVGVSAGFGETWTYRQMTSEPDVEPRTYGAAVNIEGHLGPIAKGERYQTEHGVWMRQDRGSFRVADNTAELKQGDQLTDPSGVYWAVMGIASTNVGTRRYDLARDVPLLAEGNRGGGV